MDFLITLRLIVIFLLVALAGIYAWWLAESWSRFSRSERLAGIALTGTYLTVAAANYLRHTQRQPPAPGTLIPLAVFAALGLAALTVALRERRK